METNLKIVVKSISLLKNNKGLEISIGDRINNSMTVTEIGVRSDDSEAIIYTLDDEGNTNRYFSGYCIDNWIVTNGRNRR